MKLNYIREFRRLYRQEGKLLRNLTKRVFIIFRVRYDLPQCKTLSGGKSNICKDEFLYINFKYNENKEIKLTFHGERSRQSLT